MKTAFAFVLFCAASAFAASLPTTPTSLQPNSTVYIVPSDAAAKLTQFIERKPRLGKRPVSLTVVGSAENAMYVVSCSVVRARDHGKLVDTFVGGYLPLHVQINVNVSKTGELVFSKEGNAGGGGTSTKQKDFYEAFFCLHQLSLAEKGKK